MTRKEQKEERKKAIIMAALELFVNQGYYETKIADIAAERQDRRPSEGQRRPERGAGPSGQSAL